MTRLLIVALIILSAAPAAAIVSVQVECGEGNSVFHVSGSVFNQMVEGDVTGWEVVLEQTWVGTCEIPTLVAAWSLPAYLNEEVFAFDLVVPAVNQYFLYTAQLRSPDGVIQSIPRYGTYPFNSALCGEAPAVRGYLEESGYLDYYEVLPCEDACDTWLCPYSIDMSNVPPEQLLPFVGTGYPVDIFGDFGTLTPMPGDPCLVGTAIRPTSDGSCGPIPVSAENWGSLKARFR